MCGSAREQLWHAVHSFAFAPATGIGNRKLCEMCSICVNKPEMMCRLPADHFENEGKTRKRKKGNRRHSTLEETETLSKLRVATATVFIFMHLFIWQKDQSRLPVCPRHFSCAHYAN